VPITKINTITSNGRIDRNLEGKPYTIKRLDSTEECRLSPRIQRVSRIIQKNHQKLQIKMLTSDR